MFQLRERCSPVEGSCAILIGMPGSGKTTLGRIISSKNNWAWVDTDYLLESWWGMPLQAIRDRLGLKGFLKAEEEIICSMKFYKTIISTGGSVVYSKKAMEYLHSLGGIVYLRANIDTIRKRLGDTSARGLAKTGHQTLEDIFLERSPLYQKSAGLVVDTDAEDPEKNAEIIVSWLKKRKN